MYLTMDFALSWSNLPFKIKESCQIFDEQHKKIEREYMSHIFSLISL